MLVGVALLALRSEPQGPELPSGPAPTVRLRARVTRVIDGDTIEVRIGRRREEVRYIGVDTPETVKPGTPVQCFGPMASSFNHRLLEGRRVRLVLGVERRDAYGRLLAYVHLGHLFVNSELVRRGLARTLTIPPNDLHAPLLRSLEQAAGRRGAGLWGAC
ncbi:MAG: thermonuclease family protein [Solirubrobacterales bacterium]